MLERWRERDVFAESLRRRAGAEQWVFYEGPPTANGPPGSHHVLSRVFKDIYPRFQTMRGYAWSARAAGTATACRSRSPSNRSSASHPRRRSRSTGSRAFNAKCRESVFAFLEEWNRLTERIGFWLDLERRLPHAR